MDWGHKATKKKKNSATTCMTLAQKKEEEKCWQWNWFCDMIRYVTWLFTVCQKDSDIDMIKRQRFPSQLNPSHLVCLLPASVWSGCSHKKRISQLCVTNKYLKSSILPLWCWLTNLYFLSLEFLIVRKKSFHHFTCYNWN